MSASVADDGRFDLRTERRDTVGPPELVGDRCARADQELRGQRGREVGRLPGRLGEIPPMRERVGRRERAERDARELAERQLDHLLHRTRRGERGNCLARALVEGRDDVAVRIVGLGRAVG